MTREELVEREFIGDMLNWSSEKFYKTFGPRLETIVIRQREILQLKLKTIWRNRKWYAFRDTGQQFDTDDAMLVYFNPKKIKHYSLHDLESIIDKLENETLYSNPKKQNLKLEI